MSNYRCPFLFFISIFYASVLFAQWEPDRRLTIDDSISSTSLNNAWCVAVGPDGYVHVVWYDNRDGNFEIYYKRSTDNGVSWEKDTRLTFAPDSSAYPAIAVSDSDVHVVWVDRRYGGPMIFYKRSTDAGLHWEPDTLLGIGSTSLYSTLPSLTASGMFIHLVWCGERGIRYKHSTDRGVSWSPDITLGGPEYCSSVAVWKNQVHVVRPDYDSTGSRCIYYRRSTDAGASWFPSVRLSSYGEVRTPCVAIWDQLVSVVWREYRGSWKVIYKRSTDNGITWLPETTLANGIYPSIAASGSNIHVIWQSVHIYYKRSSDSGNTWSLDTMLTSTSGSFAYPSVTTYGRGVHVVWRCSQPGNFEIYYKRNPTGNVVIEEKIGQLIVHYSPFTICPNPFTSSAVILGHETEYFILYDIAGRLIRIYRGDRIGLGLSAGVYFLIPEVKKTKPMRIIKVR